jgi:hypothetical protein
VRTASFLTGAQRAKLLSTNAERFLTGLPGLT